MRIILIIACAIALTSCALPGPVIAPSTAAVQARLDTAQSEVSDAQRSANEALAQNGAAKTKAQRIEDKVMVIDRYWKDSSK